MSTFIFDNYLALLTPVSLALNNRYVAKSKNSRSRFYYFFRLWGAGGKDFSCPGLGGFVTLTISDLYFTLLCILHIT